LIRAKNLTETISDWIVSPMAHRLDLDAGQGNTIVLLQTPSASFEKRPEGSTPATDVVTVFAFKERSVDVEEAELGRRGISGRVSFTVIVDAAENEGDEALELCRDKKGS